MNEESLFISGHDTTVSAASGQEPYRPPFVPALNRFYLAVPHRGPQPAEIRVYEVLP